MALARAKVLIAFWTIAILVVIVIFSAAVALLGNPAVGLGMFVILPIIFLLQGLRDVSSDPPKRATLKYMGKFFDEENGGVSFSAGLIFLPLAGALFSLKTYNDGRLNLDMSFVERTPTDKGTVEVEMFFIYIVNPLRSVFFVKNGREAGIAKRFSEQVAARIRVWIQSFNEGPQTWEEAQQSNGLATDILIDTLCPGVLPGIPSTILADIPDGNEIPMTAFLKYFLGVPKLSEKNPREKGLQKKLDGIKTTDPGLWTSLRHAIRIRMAYVEKIKRGDGISINIDNFGITLQLASLGKIAPVGTTAAAADRVAAAKQDAQVNLIKSRNLTQRVDEFAKKHNNDSKAATEAIQIQDGSIKKEVKEQQLAIRKDNLDVLEALAKLVFNKFKP